MVVFNVGRYNKASSAAVTLRIGVNPIHDLKNSWCNFSPFILDFCNKRLS